jgi:hypothetical protein
VLSVITLVESPQVESEHFEVSTPVEEVGLEQATTNITMLRIKITFFIVINILILNFLYRGKDSNFHGLSAQLILSQPCLPFHHRGIYFFIIINI